jgi:hypothetical protein
LQMTRALLLHHEGRLKAWRLRRLWRPRGWRLPRALLMLEALALGMLGQRPPQRSSMPTPSVQSLVGRRTCSGTSLTLTWHWEVQKHPVRRDLHLRPRAQGCHKDRLTGITPLGRRTGSKTMRTCKPCVSYGPPWAHYLGGYQDRLLGGPLRLPGLRYTASEGVEHKDYIGVVLG